MKNRKLIGAMILLFISGGLIGFVSGFYSCNNRWRTNIQNRKNSSMMGKHLIKRFEHELRLTEEQVKQIEPVFADFIKKQRAVDKLYRPQKLKNIQTLMTEIKKFLDPNQLEKMSRLEEDRKIFFGKRDVKGPSRNGSPRKHEGFHKSRRDGSDRERPPRSDNELPPPPPKER